VHSKLKLQIDSKQKIHYMIHQCTPKVDSIHLQSPRSIYDYSYNFKTNIEKYVYPLSRAAVASAKLK